jgi:muramoyltetrapeptide carboxypeptidase LdcA involved in peptidoglycan recycling
MAPTIIPKALQPGDTIAFISPSERLNNVLPDVMTRATAVLKARGYNIRTFFSEDTGIQSSISNRLSEIRAAFSDKNISAIICTIGGTTFTELLPALIADTELHGIIRENPKIVVGYSDISGLHWFLHALTGLRTFYGARRSEPHQRQDVAASILREQSIPCDCFARTARRDPSVGDVRA